MMDMGVVIADLPCKNLNMEIRSFQLKTADLHVEILAREIRNDHPHVHHLIGLSSSHLTLKRIDG